MTKKHTGPLALAVIFLLINHAASAEKLKLPSGMGGVPDIGAISCSVFNSMLRVGALGTKRLLLTYAQGYYLARFGKSIDEIIEASDGSWNFESLTGHFSDYCADNPEAMTSEAVIDLGEKLIALPPQEN